MNAQVKFPSPYELKAPQGAEGWRDLYPYSAVHVVRVTSPLDAARLTRVASTHLQELGYAELRLDRRRRRYEWLATAAPVEIAVVPAEDRAGAVVREEIEHQLNIAFPRQGRFRPFRFFAIDAGLDFHFGVAYDHFVAAGDSIVRLLGGMVVRYGGEGALPADARMRRPAAGYTRLFLRHALPMLKGLSSLPALIARSRRSFRPRLKVPEDGSNAFTSFRLDAADNVALLHAAGEWGVTHNDVFIALLLKTLSPLALGRRSARRRTELAVASIVNVRRDFGADAESVLGPLLASFQISHRVPDDIGLETLSRLVNAETTRIKRRKLYLQTLLLLAYAVWQWRFLSPERRHRFFTKHHPVWAGMTPLNVTSLWSSAGFPGLAPEYIRGVSTGPHTPMVVALSTSGDITHVGITFRTTAFERGTIDNLVADILHDIKSLQ